MAGNDEAARRTAVGLRDQARRIPGAGGEKQEWRDPLLAAEQVSEQEIPLYCRGLADLPNGTVVDGELVGRDDTGRPDFYLLQNLRGEASRIY